MPQRAAQPRPWEMTTAFRKMDKVKATAAYAATWVPVLALTPAPVLLPTAAYAAVRTGMTYAGKDQWDAWYDTKYGKPGEEPKTRMVMRKTAGPIKWMRRKMDAANRLEQLIPHAEHAVHTMQKSRQDFDDAKKKLPWVVGGVGALGLLGAGGAYMVGRRHGAAQDEDAGEGEKRAYLERHYKQAFVGVGQPAPNALGADPPSNQRPGASQMGLGTQPNPATQPAQPLSQGMALPKPQPSGYASMNAARRSGAVQPRPSAPSMGAGNMGLGVAQMGRQMNPPKLAHVDKEAATRMAREGYGALDAAMRWTNKQGPAHTQQYAKKIQQMAQSKTNPKPHLARKAEPSMWSRLVRPRISDYPHRGLMPDPNLHEKLRSNSAFLDPNTTTRLAAKGAPIRTTREIQQNLADNRSRIIEMKRKPNVQKKIDGRINDVLQNPRTGYLNPNSSVSKDKHLGVLFRKGTSRDNFEKGFVGKAFRKDYEQTARKNRRTIESEMSDDRYYGVGRYAPKKSRTSAEATRINNIDQDKLDKAVRREADRAEFYKNQQGDQPVNLPKRRDAPSPSMSSLNFGGGDFM